MHDSVHAFAARALSEEAVRGARVLSVGSYNVNGSLRASVMALGAASYVGIDMRDGPEVDMVRDACVPGLCDSVGGPFDIVICTEMLEHAENWRAAVRNLKECVRPGGLVLLTTRSKGFALHEYPSDYWRFSVDDMRRIFSDHDVLAAEADPDAPGVFVLARRTRDPEADLEAVEAWSMRLNVVTWKWGNVFGPEYVNRLRSMFARHLHVPHRFVCVTDNPSGVESDIEIVDPRTSCLNALEMWDVDEKMNGSACLRRLAQYDAAASRVLGNRFLSIDLDLVLVGDVTPLFDKPEPLRLMNWTYTGGTIYGGGIVLADAGALQGMWDAYRADPVGYGEASRGADSIFIARRALRPPVPVPTRAKPRVVVKGITYQFVPAMEKRPQREHHSKFGPPSDQSVLNHYLRQNKIVPTTWSEADGIVRYFSGSRAAYGPPLTSVPPGVRIVVFGHDDKGVMDNYEHEWIREYWR